MAVDVLSLSMEESLTLLGKRLGNYNWDREAPLMHGFDTFAKKVLRARAPLAEKFGQTGRIVVPIEEVIPSSKRVVEILNRAPAGYRYGPFSLGTLSNSGDIRVFASRHLPENMTFTARYTPLTAYPYCRALPSNKMLSVQFFKGERTTRAYQKLLEAIGYDSPDGIRSLVQALGDAQAASNLKGSLVLSVNPLDVMMMTEVASFTSCHRWMGEYCVGTTQYTTAPNVGIAFAYMEVAEENIAGEVYNFPYRLWRTMVHFDDNSVATQDTYGDGPDTLHQLVVKGFADALIGEGNYSLTDKRVDLPHTEDAFGFKGSATEPRVYAVRNGTEPPAFYTLGLLSCPSCGHDSTEDGMRWHQSSLFCANCYNLANYETSFPYDEEHVCYNCREIISDYAWEQGNYTEVAGDIYCRNCYNDLFTWCDGCRNYAYRDDTERVENCNCTYCDDCVSSNRVPHCKKCDKLGCVGEHNANDLYLCDDCKSAEEEDEAEQTKSKARSAWN